MRSRVFSWLWGVAACLSGAALAAGASPVPPPGPAAGGPIAVEVLDSTDISPTVEAVTGRRPTFEMCPGLLETRFYAQRGIPAVAYGPGILAVSHGPKEFVPIQNIRDCAAVYAMIAQEALAE